MKNKKDYTIKELCNLKYQKRNLVVPLGYANKKKLFYINLENISGLFIAGSTGTGKSVFIDDLIVGLIHKNKPSEVNFIMLDPKKIELGEYNGIKHLIGKKNKSNSIKGYDLLMYLLKLMEFRIKLLTITHHRSISGYNRVEKDKWPHVFVVVDEACDIIKIKDTYTVFSKILEFGECIGIHLIFATNSYLKDYANSNFLDKFKYRMSFDLSSVEQEDFINIKGSSWLKGSGEALIKCPNGRICKFQAPHVTNEEIERIVVDNQNES